MRLSEIGVTLDRHGKLKVDQEKFAEAQKKQQRWLRSDVQW